MGETVLYSSLTFKKDLRHEAAVTQDEDVTYAEVRSTNPTSCDTVSQNAPAEVSVGSSHPYRLAAVCLGLLCALLLAATSVLCVFYTSLSQTYSLLERDLEELRASNSTMIQERDQLQRNYTILKRERDQLQTNYTRQNTERDQLQRDNSIFQQAVLKKFPFIDQYCPYSSQKRECKPCPQGWKQFDSKCYYFSTEYKGWTESRIDCIKRGADLVIIESKKEQDSISSNLTYYNHWIGLSDSVTEGIWLWVDGSRLQRGFWGSKEPDNKPWSYTTQYQGADCAVTVLSDNVWMDTSCDSYNRFICETDALLL
ncbi:hypothetical protein GJAV_G00171480 [Gymnothorax javanicus]|nr:hypothetical protein GJAV_G00171480 [Gymnothorax javanicus]